MTTSDTDRLASETEIGRIGPVGRLVRIFGAVMMALFAYDWLEAGMTWFGRSSTPANPWIWIVTGLAVFYGLYQLPDSGFGRPWGERTVMGSGGLFLAAAFATVALHGELWAPPLTGLIYGLDVAFLLVIAISYLVAVFLGTPGCEVGGLGELIRRLRHTPHATEQEAMWCIIGLHCLDEWEAGRRQK